MGLYNMIHGVTLATFLVMPMLGKHPEDYPRFRDCFLSDKEHPEYDDYIHVYTRVGGNNRGEGFGEEELFQHPNFVATFDDSFDSTYATYVFSVPEQWCEDFNCVKEGRIKDISEEYQAEVRRIFPNMYQFKAILDELWGLEDSITNHSTPIADQEIGVNGEN